MIRGMLSRPIALSMAYVMLGILGIFSFLSIKIEGAPDTEMPQLVVSTSWGSTTPEVVQIFLTSPIEEVGALIEGLEEIESSSTRGNSEVTLRFNRDTDMEFARLDLNERLSGLRAALPPGASQPLISMLEKNDGQQRDKDRFMRFDISGPFDMSELTELYNDHIRDEISSVDGVAEVQLQGQLEKSLNIKLNREKMDLYRLIPQQVAMRITEMTEIYEAPRTTYENQTVTVALQNSISNTEAVEDRVVGEYRGQPIRVKDVGFVELGHARPFSLSRLNGNPTLQVTVRKEVGTSVIQTAKGVRDRVEQILTTMPPGFRLEWSDDEGLMMEEQLASVYDRSFWCLALIAVLLLFFLQSISSTIIITLNIVFSALITINFMYYFDIDFNIITLSGLAIGFGMLVDNAIVVLENIFRHRELGKSKMEAAIIGVQEIMWAVIAATLTTVAAFLCMTLLRDRLSVTYMPLALSVIFSNSASLFVSFTLTPILSLVMGGSNIERRASGEVTWAQRYIGDPLERITDFYEHIVHWTLRHKMLVFTIVGLFFFMYVRIFMHEIDKGGFNFRFSPDDKVIVFIRMPEGAELETADDVIKQFEQPLIGVEGYKDMSVVVNQAFAMLEVSFDPDMLSSAYPLALKSKLIGIAQRFAGVGIYVGGISSDDNYSSGSTGFESYNSSIKLLGYNYKRLMDYGQQVLRGIERNNRVKATKLETSQRSFRERDQTETVMVINREALRQYDITISYLMRFLQVNLREESRAFTRFQGEEMMVEIKFEDTDTFDIKALENLIVTTPTFQRIRLADLVAIEERLVPGGIDRKDQQYMVNVRWDYKASPKKARTFNEDVYAALDLPPGFSAELENTEFLSEEENTNLHQVTILAIIVVFMIIAGLYESFVDPFVIFLTIPLSFIGVSWIYSYTGNSFDSTAYIGLIVLAGIVVSNSILLVTHISEEISHMHETGLNLHQAVARAARHRLRPIMLTAITCIAGLLPLLEDLVVWIFTNPVGAFLCRLFDYHYSGGDAENAGLQDTLAMFSSLSRSTLGGMITATLSTLFVIPVVYVAFFRAKQWIHTRINEVFHLTGNPAD